MDSVCYTCREPRSESEFPLGMDGKPLRRCRDCRAVMLENRTLIESGRRRCMRCRKVKMIASAFRPVNGTRGGKSIVTVVHTCRRCERIRQAEHRDTEQGKAAQRACRLARGKRAYKPWDEKAKSRKTRWRKTTLGKLSMAITRCKGLIARSDDPAKIARWRTEIATAEAIRKRIWDEMGGKGYTGKLDRAPTVRNSESRT